MSIDTKTRAIEELRKYLNTNAVQEGDFTIKEAIEYFGLGREQVRSKLEELVKAGVYKKVQLPGNKVVYRLVS